jgi:metal-dependent amidase/aminoacylase/carboxypeptidase family protein
MPVINRITEFSEDMTAWRRDFHAYPETAFEEKRTSDIVAAKLEEFGIEVHRGLARCRRHPEYRPRAVHRPARRSGCP